MGEREQRSLERIRTGPVESPRVFIPKENAPGDVESPPLSREIACGRNCVRRLFATFYYLLLLLERVAHSKQQETVEALAHRTFVDTYCLRGNTDRYYSFGQIFLHSLI